MPRQKAKLTPLEARKQLLVLESELNRRLLVEAVTDWQIEFHQTKQHLMNLGSTVSTVAKVASTISAVGKVFTGNGKKDDGRKKSWISSVFNGVSTGMSIWNAFRSRNDKPEA